jgi:hypothetical protein
MNIPIIIVHTGNSFYLDPVLKQAHIFNPDKKIIFICKDVPEKYDFIDYVPMEDYMHEAKVFEKRYIHLSSNPYSFELLCFQRWFIILDFCRKHNIEQFFQMDSDVLLYSNVGYELENYDCNEIAICNKICPAATYFKTEILYRFCDFIKDMYSEQNRDKIYNFYADFQKQKRMGGVCDMMAFKWFVEDTDVKIEELSRVAGGAIFDSSIRESCGFEMEGR